MKQKLSLFTTFIFILFLSCDSDSSDDVQLVCNNPDYEIVNGILNGDLFFKSQEEINEFDWTCITAVSGNLYIGYQTAPSLDLPITNLTNLSVLESVGGLIISFNEELTSLNGLQNIVSLTESGLLMISNNELLESLDGLDNLPSFIGSINISENDNLISINQLDNITHANSIYVADNPAMENLIGLQNIEFVSVISIISNSSLVNLIGIPSFDAIASIETSALRRVTISYNDGLQSLEGIGGINLDGKLDISHNVNLSTISHLIDLTRTDRFDLRDNDLLSSLIGLENLVLVDGPFQIFGNSILSDYCALTNLAVDGTINGPFSASQCAYNPSIEDIADGNCSN